MELSIRSPSTLKYLGLTLGLSSDGGFFFSEHARTPVNCNNFQETVSVASFNFCRRPSDGSLAAFVLINLFGGRDVGISTLVSLSDEFFTCVL